MSEQKMSGKKSCEKAACACGCCRQLEAELQLAHELALRARVPAVRLHVAHRGPPQAPPEGLPRRPDAAQLLWRPRCKARARPAEGLPLQALRVFVPDEGEAMTHAPPPAVRDLPSPVKLARPLVLPFCRRRGQSAGLDVIRRCYPSSRSPLPVL